MFALEAERIRIIATLWLHSFVYPTHTTGTMRERNHSYKRPGSSAKRLRVIVTAVCPAFICTSLESKRSEADSEHVSQ